MARLDELWRAAGGPGVPPGLDVRRVKARVNAALDADQQERKIYMKQKLRTALLAAAAMAVLTGSAFAATTGWNGLSGWFRGDTTPVQEYVDSTVRTVTDKNYTLTVEGCAGDESSAYLTVTVTALSDEAKEFLWGESFISMDTFEAWVPAQEPDAPSGSLRPVGHGSKELKADADDSRRFALEADLPYPVDSLHVRCGYMEKGKSIEVPLAPAPSKTVKIGAKGTGVLDLGPDTPAQPEAFTIDEITFSSLTIHIKGSLSYGTRPNIRLRMADGTVRTQSQMMDPTSWGASTASYRFKEVQDLDSIVSLIVFDKEYPVDGSKPTPVEHDGALDPFTVTRMEPLEEGKGFSLPVRELTERLGGTCTWDPDTGDVTCVYRDTAIVLHAGKDTALVNGREVEMRCAPAEREGTLAADYQVFYSAWGISGFVQRENIRNEKDYTDVTIVWGDWYVIP